MIELSHSIQGYLLWLNPDTESAITSSDFDFSRTVTTSPGMTRYEGMFTFLPFTLMCLWITESSIKWKNSNLVTENSGNALSATRATQDGNGNVIADTYARKKWVYLGNAGKGGGSFSYDVTLNGGKEFLLVIYIAPINDDIGFFETHYIPYDVFTETAAHTNGIVDYSIKVDNENVYNGSKVNVSFNRGGFLFTNNTGNCDMKVYVKK